MMRGLLTYRIKSRTPEVNRVRNYGGADGINGASCSTGTPCSVVVFGNIRFEASL